MTADTRPLLKFLPWLLASAAAHAVLLVSWPTGDMNNNAVAEPSGVLQVQLLSNRLPVVPSNSAASAAIQPEVKAAPTSVSAGASVAQHSVAAPQPTQVAPRRLVANAATVPTLPAPTSTVLHTDTRAVDTQAVNALDAARQTELMTLLHQAIDRNKRYPQAALSMGREGSARIDFQLGPDGQIANLSIGDSSGMRALDSAAYRAVQNIAPFPQADRYLDRAQRFQVDVVFRIN